MKMRAVVLTIILLASVPALPVHAMGHGMGSGGMSDGWASALMGSLTDRLQDRGSYSVPAGTQEYQAESPGREYRQYNEPNRLKDQISAKEKEFDSILNSAKPETDKLRMLNRQIRELRAQLDEVRRTQRPEASWADPGYPPDGPSRSGSYGMSRARGSDHMRYGGHMGGY